MIFLLIGILAFEDARDSAFAHDEDASGRFVEDEGFQFDRETS